MSRAACVEAQLHFMLSVTPSVFTKRDPVKSTPTNWNGLDRDAHNSDSGDEGLLL